MDFAAEEPDSAATDGPKATAVDNGNFPHASPAATVALAGGG